MNIHKQIFMYYNIYLLVVIAFKCMMIYNTEWTCCIHLSTMDYISHSYNVL